MNDTKNIFIAWISSGPPMLAVFATESGITVLSAIVLPIIFFAIGKTIDVFCRFICEIGRRKERRKRNRDT